MSGHFDWTIFIYKQKTLKRSNHWRKFRFSDCVATCRPMQVLHWAVAFFPFCVRRMTAATTVLDSFVESCRNDRVNEWMAAKSSSSSSLAQQFRLLKLLRRSCFSPRDDDEQQMNVDPFFFSLSSCPQKKRKKSWMQLIWMSDLQLKADHVPPGAEVKVIFGPSGWRSLLHLLCTKRPRFLIWPDIVLFCCFSTPNGNLMKKHKIRFE